MHSIRALMMRPRKMWYRPPVTEKEVTGLGSPNNESAQPRNAAFLCAYTSLRLQWAAMVGKPQGLPVCFRAGLPTLSFAALPAYSGRRFNRNEGGHMPSTNKSEQFSNIVVANQPAYLSNRPNNKSADKLNNFEKLPFVYRPTRGFKKSNWYTPPTNSYARACEIGSEYATHFVQFLKDNPTCVGMNMLGFIVEDIDFTDNTEAKGYAVGFFSHLEHLL